MRISHRKYENMSIFCLNLIQFTSYLDPSYTLMHRTFLNVWRKSGVFMMSSWRPTQNWWNRPFQSKSAEVSSYCAKIKQQNWFMSKDRYIRQKKRGQTTPCLLPFKSYGRCKFFPKLAPNWWRPHDVIIIYMTKYVFLKLLSILYYRKKIDPYH